MTTHHTTTQKIQHVHDWRASGLTRFQYRRLHGLSSHAFHEWLRLPDDGVSVAEYPVLLPVCIQPSPELAPAGGVITLPLSRRLALSLLEENRKKDAFLNEKNHQIRLLKEALMLAHQQRFGC